jgi:hypothetical protein
LQGQSGMSIPTAARQGPVSSPSVTCPV